MLHPLVYTSSGHLLPATPILLGALESKQVLLRDILRAEKSVEAHDQAATGEHEDDADSEGESREGQIGFSFEGAAMDVAAQIVIANEELKLSFNHVFMAAMGHTSDLEGVYYLPSPSSSVKLALANISEEPLKAKVSFSSESSRESDTSLELPPHTTKVVGNANREETGEFGGSRSAGSVSITYTGAPGAVVAQGMVSDRRGFSTNIWLVDPGSLTSNRLLNPVASFEDATPVIVARNLTTKAVEIKPDVHYTIYGDNQILNLSARVLAPQESQVFSLADDFKGLPTGASNIALELTSSESASIVADFLLLDGANVKAVQVTPKDVDSESAPAYDYPWRVNSESDTLISFVNPSATDDLTYSLSIYYGGNRPYSYHEHTLRPGEARQISVADLIARQVPDDSGITLPADLTAGQAKLTVHSSLEKQVRLLGEAVLIDRGKHLAATLSCAVCPPDPAYIRWVGDTEGDVGQTLTIQIWEYFDDYSHMILWCPSMWSSDPTIADRGGCGYDNPINLKSGGDVTFWVNRDTCSYGPYPRETCDCSTPVLLSLNIIVYSDPVLTGIQPAKGPVSNSPTRVRLSGRGFGPAYSVHVNAGAGITATVVSATDTEIQADFAISTLAPRGDRPITVSSGAATSRASVNFYVQVPATLSIVPGSDSTIPEATCPVGTETGCGSTRSFIYQVVGQDGLPIEAAGLPLWDEIHTTSPNVLGLTGYNTTCNPPNTGPCGVNTDSAGRFREAVLSACSTACIASGVCRTAGPTNADQTWHIGPFAIVQRISYYCERVLVNGQ